MNRVLIILLLFFTSCNFLYKKSEEIQNFENTLKSLLSFESNFFESKQYFDGEAIVRPPGSWQELISTENYCLNYKVPISRIEGVLQIVSKNESDKCPSLPTTNEIRSIKGISDFKIKFTTNHIQGKFIRNGHYGLVLSYTFDNKSRELKITLPNKLRSRTFITTKMKKYSSSGTYRMGKGVRVTKESTASLRSSMWFGEWDIKESSQINFCERKNNQCETYGHSICEECLYGWEYVVDYNCSGGGSKVCSPAKCGTKGRPACPRGIVWSGKSMRELCFDDSPAGFCQDDLRVICGEDNILICI